MAHIEPAGLPAVFGGMNGGNKLLTESTTVAIIVIIAWIVIWTGSARGGWLRATLGLDERLTSHALFDVPRQVSRKSITKREALTRPASQGQRKSTDVSVRSRDVSWI